MWVLLVTAVVEVGSCDDGCANSDGGDVADAGNSDELVCMVWDVVCV